MKLRNDLEYLHGLIELTEEQANERNLLEHSFSNLDKVLLIDADSLLFNVVNFHKDKETEEDLELQYEDFHTQVRSIANRIEDDGFNVEEIIYFFTTCKNNFRKEINPEYKANRPQDKTRFLVGLLKHYTIQMLEDEMSDVKYSDTLEADDLIAQATYFYDNAIIVSIDKDLKQLEGIHFDYYKLKTGEIDELGNELREYKGWTYTTKQKGFNLLLYMLLMGDKADNIKGVDGIGIKTAKKILDNRNNFGKLRTVIEKYNDINRLRNNIKLIKL